MITRSLMLFLPGTALGACAGHAERPQHAIAAPTMIAATFAQETPERAQVAELPGSLSPARQLIDISASRRTSDGADPTTRVDVANRSALREPTRQGFMNAVQVYPWVEGAVYRLYAAPEQVSDIALQVGEGLVSVAAGDTVRWIIGDTTSGSGNSKRTHILVKPSAPGLKTNLVIMTDMRVYHLQLDSTARTAMAMLSWTYPADALLAITRRNTEAEAAMPIASGMALDSLNFAYRISGDDPSWRPIRTFDDGTQVFIEFPATLGQGEAPPLFVTGKKGEAQLVNYRQRGRYYIVDRLFTSAELRLGGRKQDVVRIERGGVGRRKGKARGGKEQ